MMNKKNTIYIFCTVAVILIIAIIICYLIVGNKANKTESKAKILIEQYDENFEINKTIEITDKKQIKKLKEIYNNCSLEQDEEFESIGVRNDIKIKIEDGKLFILQTELEDYCYYENSETNTNLTIKMPDELLQIVNYYMNNNS